MRSLLVLWVAVLAGAAQAAPIVDVRARTRITVDSVERTGSGVHVRGLLVDAGTGEGVGGRDVIIDVTTGGDALSHPVTTGRSGRYDLYLELEAGRHLVAARFAGDEIYGEAGFEARAFDVDRAQLALEVKVPPALDASVETVEVIITATSSEGPEQVHVSVRAGDATGPSALGAAVELTTGEDGSGRIEIPRDRLGRPGDKRIVAHADGGDTFNPVEAEASFLLFTSTQIAELASPTGPVAYEHDIKIGGKLVDGEGKPVSAALVALKQGDLAVAETVTDGKGRFTLRTSASRFLPGTLAFIVEHQSTVGWRRGTRSSPISVEIARPRPVPGWASLAATAITALAALGYVLLRTRPWQRFLDAWRRRRRRPETDVAPGGVGEDEKTPAPGLTLARPGIMSSLRRAGDHGFSGRTSDVIRGVPVAGARLVLRAGDDERELVTDEHGHFETELPPAMWKVTVSARGYVTLSVNAPVPHRGELRGARIDLLPVRERVFALYRELAVPLLPKAELWGIWTPREILDHVRAQRPAGALGALTDLVEEATFAEPMPDEAVLSQTAEAVRAARIELTR